MFVFLLTRTSVRFIIHTNKGSMQEQEQKMAKRETHIYVNGTSALKMPSSRDCICSNVIDYPRIRKANKRQTTETGMHHPSGSIPSILASSEMFCSMISESALGCPYRAISNFDAKIASYAISAIAVIALVIGA